MLKSSLRRADRVEIASVRFSIQKEGEPLFEEPLLTRDCGLTGRFAAVPADLPPKGQLPSTTFRRIKQWIKMT
jgi:hypothetical protein